MVSLATNYLRWIYWSVRRAHCMMFHFNDIDLVQDFRSGYGPGAIIACLKCVHMMKRIATPVAEDTHHFLTMQSVQSGAERGICSCGWKSGVSDDGNIFRGSYYSAEDIRRDFAEHVRLGK